MYSSPRSALKPLRRQVSEGPIAEFISVIEDTEASNWQKRAAAFQQLLDEVPENAFEEESGSAWYNSAATLRHLAISIGELLKDPRSTVVKRTCVALTTLFERCRGDARYLFKDLMPTILSVHAQTVQVIRQAVENMVMESIPVVPCKMVMPLWMERLRIDRSRTVRDACALYLGHSLRHWNEAGYLTDEIWFQVGRTLLGSVRDPSPNVRAYSKQVLEETQRSHPTVFEQLLNDEDGPAGKDFKLRRWLKNLGQSAAHGGADAAEDLSVASRFTYNSDMRMRSKAVETANAFGSPARLPSRANDDDGAVPNSISLTKGRRKSDGARQGQPPRAPAQKTSIPRNEELTDDSDEGISKQHSHESEESGSNFPSDLNLSSWRETIKKSVDSSAGRIDSRFNLTSPPGIKLNSSADPSTPDTPLVFQPTASTVSALANNTNDSGSNVQQQQAEKVVKDAEAQEDQQDGKITDMKALKKYSKRRTRSSLLIQERLRVSSSVEDEDFGQSSTVSQKRSDEENNMPNPAQAPKSASKPPVHPGVKGSPAASNQVQQAPEHMVIAIRLLRAHKEHVDTIMETLRIEMDTLRDFDQLLEEAGRPTEEEVLDYYESVGLCLEQRSAAGERLQDELDRVSRGEPPLED